MCVRECDCVCMCARVCMRRCMPVCGCTRVSAHVSGCICMMCVRVCVGESKTYLSQIIYNIYCYKVYVLFVFSYPYISYVDIWTSLDHMDITWSYLHHMIIWTSHDNMHMTWWYPLDITWYYALHGDKHDDKHDHIHDHMHDGMNYNYLGTMGL